MLKIPQIITQFIARQHVVSIAAADETEVWAASCFYAFDEPAARLIVLTSKSTHHGGLMLNRPRIGGTIAVQTENIRHIQGVQFRAVARCLEDKAGRQTALAIYCERHPVARLAKLLQTDVWELVLTEIKYTENKLAFARKTHWLAEDV